MPASARSTSRPSLRPGHSEARWGKSENAAAVLKCGDAQSPGTSRGAPIPARQCSCRRFGGVTTRRTCNALEITNRSVWGGVAFASNCSSIFAPADGGALLALFEHACRGTWEEDPAPARLLSVGPLWPRTQRPSFATPGHCGDSRTSLAHRPLTQLNSRYRLGLASIGIRHYRPANMPIM